jgi:hypothetical protein
MNMKNVLLTTGISLITAGIGFIIGSKWTEKEIKQRTEDFYQKEYDLLKKRFEEDKEQEIRDDQKRKDAEIVEEVKKMQDGIRAGRHEDDRGRVDWSVEENSDLDDEEELEEFGGKTEENDIWENSEVERPRNLCQTQEELDDYDRILYEDRMRREQGSDVYLISYDDYWESRDREEVDLMYDPNTEHLWNEEDPEEELDVDNLVSYEALEILREGYSDIVYVRNDRLDTDFVIQRLDPRD